MSLDSPGPMTLDPSGMLLYPEPGKGWNEVRLEDVLRWRPGTQVPVIRHPVARYPTNGRLKVLRDHSGCLWFGVQLGVDYNCGNGPDNASYAGPPPRANVHEGVNGNMVLWGDSVVAVGPGEPGTGESAIVSGFVGRTSLRMPSA